MLLKEIIRGLYLTRGKDSDTFKNFKSLLEGKSIYVKEKPLNGRTSESRERRYEEDHFIYFNTRESGSKTTARSKSEGEDSRHLSTVRKSTFGVGRKITRSSNRSIRQSIVVGKNPGFDSFEISNSSNRAPGSPGISTVLWSTISRSGLFNMPKGVERPSEEEIRRSDLESINRYRRKSNNIGYHLSSLIYKSACSVAEEFDFFHQKSDHIIERDINLILNNTSRSTSAGWPTFKLKNSHYAKQDAKEWLNKFSKLDKADFGDINPLMFNPNFIGHRYQGKYDETRDVITTKIRQIWMQPYRILCLESKFFNNIIDNVIKGNVVNKTPIYASGLRNSEIGLQMNRFRNMFKNMLQQGLPVAIYSLDYEKYDSTIHSYFMDVFYSIYKQRMLFENNEEFEYDLLRLYSKFSPFMYDSKIYFQERGVNSGSLITNFFDTFVNCTLLRCVQYIISDPNIVRNIIKNSKNRDIINVSLLKHTSIDKISRFNDPFQKEIITMGDDGLVIFTKQQLYILKLLCRELDMKVGVKNVTKRINEPIFFLGRYWNEFGEPFQSDKYLITHCVFRERFYPKGYLDLDISEELEPARIISICCSLSNGFDFMQRAFKDFPQLWRFISSRTHFPLLKDVYPFEGYQLREILEIYDWRNF